MSDLPPAPPNYLPEQPDFNKGSRYHRRRRSFPISLWGLLIGLGVGVALALFIAWGPGAPIEFDTRPSQLRLADRDQYIAAIALAFDYDSNLALAIQRLTQLDLGPDPFAAVAETACRWVQTGQIDSNASVRALNSMVTFYQLQDRRGCADEWVAQLEQPPLEVTVAIPTPTRTLPPPPTKTPVTILAVTPTPTPLIIPTQISLQEYDGRIQSTFCDSELSGIIEVYVQGDGDGVRGVQVAVQWDTGEDRFVTGLKPDRGPAYADFTMEPGESYTVVLPGLSDPVSGTIVANSCFTVDGDNAITSYRVVFQ